ncbi:MAG TPA: NAD(P)H-dependent oxidoreductase [Acetobacteraceae bacterium]|jgi:FMN-dependent NADH-azoreductase|nr:NAD(P)H-dependent oxidoreductase [Acetobacteraceae bacterium]
MRTILHLTVSPRGAEAYSHRISSELVAALCARHPGARVLARDLAAEPPVLVDLSFTRAIRDPAALDAPAFTVSQMLIAELERADALVIGTPMHNFTVPAPLKAWIDQIVRIHRSFRSTPSGKVGLLRDRPSFVVIASGGYFSGPSPSGTPAQPDHLTPYLRDILATIGITDLTFITLEGVTRGEEAIAAALANARTRIAALPVIARSASDGAISMPE